MKYLFFILFSFNSFASMQILSTSKWKYNSSATKQFPLALVANKNSYWSDRDKTRVAVDKLQQIFMTCDVAFSEVDFWVVKFSDDVLEPIRKPNPYKGPGEIAVAKLSNLPSVRPLGLLFATDIPSTAKAYNAESVRRLRTATIDPSALLNTFFMTHDWYDNRRVPGGTDSYDTMAHELAHILGNMGHIDVFANLMSTYDGEGSKTGDLTPEQCELIQSFSN
jgi:hypothetical protein